MDSVATLVKTPLNVLTSNFQRVRTEKRKKGLAESEAKYRPDAEAYLLRFPEPYTVSSESYHKWRGSFLGLIKNTNDPVELEMLQTILCKVAKKARTTQDQDQLDILKSKIERKLENPPR